MKTLISAALAVVLGLAGTAEAQVLDKIKDAGRKALNKQAQDLTRSRPPTVQDSNRKYPPGLSYSSVLNGVQILAKQGKFRMDNVQATFLPPEHKRGFSVLRTAAGQELYQFDWQIQELKKPYSLLSVNKTTNLGTGESSSASAIDLTSPGDYVLDFYLPTEHFYMLPFSVSLIGSEDPFGEGQCYRLDGDWQDWGYLYYRDAEPDQNLEWKIWLRNEACENRTVAVRIKVTRDSDGVVVCTSREFTSHNLHPKWDRIAFGLVFPKEAQVPHGTYFKAKDLLAHDGPHDSRRQALRHMEVQHRGRRAQLRRPHRARCRRTADFHRRRAGCLVVRQGQVRAHAGGRATRPPCICHVLSERCAARTFSEPPAA